MTIGLTLGRMRIARTCARGGLACRAGLTLCCFIGRLGEDGLPIFGLPGGVEGRLGDDGLFGTGAEGLVGLDGLFGVGLEGLLGEEGRLPPKLEEPGLLPPDDGRLPENPPEGRLPPENPPLLLPPDERDPPKPPLLIATSFLLWHNNIRYVEY